MTCAHADLSNRDIRQREIVPPAKLANVVGLVIGVGAIGRQVALQLAAVGLPELYLVDDDVVAVENLASQGYWPEDLDEKKVAATSRLCRSINPQATVHGRAERFRRFFGKELPRNGKSRVIFCCVDSMTTRRLIFESLKPHVDLFIDGRMNAEVIRVLAAASPAVDGHYATTLFGDEQAYGGSCTVRSTIFTASIAAGMMLGEFTKWLRGMPVDRDVLLNLLSTELSLL